jgi:syntaxin-binding protein 1
MSLTRHEVCNSGLVSDIGPLEASIPSVQLTLSAAAHSGWKILIVDDPSMKVLSSAVGMYDIMERQISLVESLDKKRAPFKELAAIYVLSPSPESVEKLLADFADKKKLLYGDTVFVYFLGPVPKPLLEKITQCKPLLKRLKALSEINVDFLVKEDRAYQLDVRQDFSSYYLRSSGNAAELAIAAKLVTLCASLNEYPYIRYKQSSGICSNLASVFKGRMDQFVSANPDWWYHGSGKSGKQSTELERSTILLLDRASDCLTPLMHDFTYQAMVQDLLTVDGDKITVEVENAENPDEYDDKDVLLNDKDKLWVELRGKHIAQVIEILSTRIAETVNSGSGNALSGSDKDVSLTELAAALKALPEYREVMAKLSQHMHISRACMDKFSAGGLIDLSELEQTLATGVDEDGDKIKSDDLVGMAESTLLRTNDSAARLRLVLIATISQSDAFSSSDRDRLLRAAKLDRDQMLTLEAASRLGSNAGAAGKKAKKKKQGLFR